MFQFFSTDPAHQAKFLNGYNTRHEGYFSIVPPTPKGKERFFVPGGTPPGPRQDGLAPCTPMSDPEH